ncbi:hypothetical protein [Glutamicibacter sp. NPDC087344]|uniref:hypothetical protein n=1 Tax=Glutamicibacter sp. NPDC087344 TaxID=3363994 RepID=UPI00380965A2
MTENFEDHKETVGPDQTPDANGENHSVPDPDNDQSSPIPFAHDEESSEKEH